MGCETRYYLYYDIFTHIIIDVSFDAAVKVSIECCEDWSHTIILHIAS